MRRVSGTGEEEALSTNSLYTGERGAEYYAQRRKLRSRVTQQERAAFFLDIADEEAITLDFGCGNGALLAHLRAARRIGVEISPYAAKDAERHLDRVVSDIAAIGTESVDRIISFHALEHVEEPSQVIRGMWRILKPDGRIKLVVPCDVPLHTAQRSWLPDDVTMHLYTWSPLTLGNLMSVCGFVIESASLAPASAGGRLGRMLPPTSQLRQSLGWLKALRSGRFHTMVTARKPAA
ncbi:MAG: class I SAM-dependent methyltransferase [Longimicrobiales bacterium]